MDQQWKEIVVEWQGGSTFIGRNKAGGEVQMGEVDGKPGVGPMELVLVGLAGCTAMDVADILAKKKEALQAFKVMVRGLRADEYPKVYKEIEVTYLLWGEDIKPSSVERAIHLSEEKYCSVSAMLCKVARIRSSYKILKPGESAG